jgi:hypothetical protein
VRLLSDVPLYGRLLRLPTNKLIFECAGKACLEQTLELLTNNVGDLRSNLEIANSGTYLGEKSD